jgi:hypothetical protein
MPSQPPLPPLLAPYVSNLPDSSCSWQVKDALRRISIFPLQFLNLRMEVLLLIESWR